MTALGAWIQNDLQMSPPQQSAFYASIFIPYSAKALYGWVSERIPLFGLRRKPYIIASCVVSTATWFTLAFLTSSIQVAFFVAILQSIAAAFIDLLLGLMLVDFAGKDMSKAGGLQSIAEAAQSGASLLSLLVGLPMYPCNGGSSSSSPQLVFAITGVISLVMIAFAIILQELPSSSIKSAPDYSYMPVDSEPLLSLQLAVKLPQREFPAIELALPGVLLLLAWSSSKSLLPSTTWMISLYVVLGLLFILSLFLWRQISRHERKISIAGKLWFLWPAFVLFLVNSAPSAMDAVYSFQYYVWYDQLCFPQYLSIVAEVTNCIASLVFFSVFHSISGTRLIVLFVISGLLTASTSLMWWPWVQGMVGSLSAPSFAYSVLTTVITSLSSQLFLITSLVVATHACPVDLRASFAYAFYLSFIDMGESVSGWITAPMTSALNISLSDYSSLGTLLWLSAICFAATLFLAPLLNYSIMKTSVTTRGRPS